jgi:hypothetical protein
VTRVGLLGDAFTCGNSRLLAYGTEGREIIYRQAVEIVAYDHPGLGK